MPWRWGPPNGRHSCLGLICLTSLRWGVVCFFCFYRHGVPALALSSSFLSSYRPACSMSRRGDFFLPTHHHVIIAYLSRRRMSLSSRAVRFFGGFIWDRLLARPAVPHPSHPYPITLPMMSLLIASLIVLLCVSHRRSPRPTTRRAGRRLAWSCGAFHVRTP